MGWVAFAVVTALLLYGSWRVWSEWIGPTRHLDRLLQALEANQTPSTFLIGHGGRMRRIGLALEGLSLRQKTLREQAQLSNFGVHALARASADGVALVDRERRVRLTNSVFRAMFGTPAELNNDSLLELVRDAGVERSLGEVYAGKSTQRSPMILPGGGDRQVEAVVEPIADDEGEILGAVALFRDLSGPRQTETLRRDFVANVSHELRTPLSILRGYLETLLENPKQPPAELLRIFEVMERHSNRLTLLIDDVLSLARLEGPGASLDLSTIRLPAFLRGMMRDWEKQFAAKKIDAQLEVADDLPPLQVDEARLQEVIYNLLDNAVKYSNDGGRIEMRAMREEETICISVADRGIGIPARDLPRIFERFFRADKSRQRDRGGTGLGLAIVKHIAQLHGGQVAAESAPGAGTTVRVYLPLVTKT